MIEAQQLELNLTHSSQRRARKSCHLGDRPPDFVVGLAIQGITRHDHRK